MVTSRRALKAGHCALMSTTVAIEGRYSSTKDDTVMSDSLRRWWSTNMLLNKSIVFYLEYYGFTWKIHYVPYCMRMHIGMSDLNGCREI
jgi:hypothetical protein